jgi:hypothetical protein
MSGRLTPEQRRAYVPKDCPFCGSNEFVEVIWVDITHYGDPDLMWLPADASCTVHFNRVPV